MHSFPCGVHLHSIKLIVVRFEMHGDELSALHFVTEVECYGSDFAVSAGLFVNDTLDILQLCSFFLCGVNGHVGALQS